jgi:LysR family transcriptional regulator, nitrogen assimilation regulatory protein
MIASAMSGEEMKVVTGIKTPLPGDTICGVDLQNLQLIVPSSQNLIRILIQKEFDLVGLKLSPAMEVDSLATVFAMIRESGWATILPASAVRENCEDDGLRCVSLVDPTICRTLVAAFPAQKAPQASAQAFIACLEAAWRAPVASSPPCS